MFGLNKLNVKTKLIIVSVTVIIISLGIVYIRNMYPISVVKINDWVFFANTDNCNYYYKSNLVNIDNQKHIITVWVKSLYTDNGKHDIINKLKESKYKKIDHSLSKVLINFQKDTYDEDRVIHYSKSGNIIGSDELSAKNDGFIPKFVLNKLLMIIIKNYNIKR